jgi:hypothetical protein
MKDGLQAPLPDITADSGNDLGGTQGFAEGGLCQLFVFTRDQVAVDSELFAKRS